MKKHIISVTEYPVLSVESVRFLRNIVRVEGKYKLQLTRDPLRAQKFGAEAIAVTEWLKKLSEANNILPITGFGSLQSFNMVDIK